MEGMVCRLLTLATGNFEACQFDPVNILPAAQGYPAPTYTIGYVQEPQVGILVEH